MIRPDVARVGSVGAYVVAALHLVGMAVLVIIEGQNFAGVMDDNAARWFADPPFIYYVHAVAWVLIPVFFIPAVTAVSELLARANAGLVRWAAALAYLACAAAMISRVSNYTFVPMRARIYLQGDELAQAAVKYATLETSLDFYYWLQYGAFGLWLLVIAVVALRPGAEKERAFSRGWAYLTLAGAILNLAVPVSQYGLAWLQAVAGILGGFVAAPLWGIWTGLRLSSFARAEHAGPARPAYGAAARTSNR